MRSHAVRVLSFSLTLFCAASVASANTPEAMLGLGARNSGMGGAGTAVANDFTAVYYNPAGLGYCGRSETGIDIHHSFYRVHVNSADPELPREERVPDMTRATIGACFRLPYRLSLGLIFGSGLQSSAGIDQTTYNDTPQFLLYGESHNQFTIAMALAYRPIRQLSIGVGAAVIVNSDLDIGVYAPISLRDENNEFADVAFDLHWGLKPTAAPYVGVTVQPIPELRIAATYRGPLKHHLHIPVTANVNTGMLISGFEPLDLTLPFIVQADTWYQPREFAFGVSVDPIPTLTITADLTWYQYSAFNSSPYPFLGVTFDPNVPSYAKALVGIPELDPVGYRDVWQPRVGAEARFLDSRFAVRGGYSVRWAAVAIPGGRNSNILDNTVNSLSLGAGYTFGPRTADEVAAHVRAREDDEPVVTVPSQDRVSFGDERSDLETPARSLPVMVRVDGYYRMSFMRERHSDFKQMDYGGRFFELGMTSSIGWY